MKIFQNNPIIGVNKNHTTAAFEKSYFFANSIAINAINTNG